MLEVEHPVRTRAHAGGSRCRGFFTCLPPLPPIAPNFIKKRQKSTFINVYSSFLHEFTLKFVLEQLGGLPWPFCTIFHHSLCVPCTLHCVVPSFDGGEPLLHPVLTYFFNLVGVAPQLPAKKCSTSGYAPPGSFAAGHLWVFYTHMCMYSTQLFWFSLST